MLKYTFVDKVGNIYNVFEYNNIFQIDSLGYPISILFYNYNSCIENDKYSCSKVLTIVKFDSTGRYLYNIKILNVEEFDFLDYFDIKFTSTNDLILNLNISDRDTLLLVDSRGITTTIHPQNPLSIDSNFNFNFKLLLCKFTSDGQFVWKNSIVRESLLSSYFSAFNFSTQIAINNNDEISVVYPIFIFDTVFAIDTFNVFDNNNQKHSFFVNTPYIFLRFSSNGNLISVKEPLKNKLTKQHIESIGLYAKMHNILSDGENTYTILRINIIKPDTFMASPPIPLQIGSNYLLFKLNNQDSIVWVKPIARLLNHPYKPFQLNRFDYDTINHELALAIPYDPFFYSFLFDSSFYGYFTGSYICRLNGNGDILSYTAIVGNDFRETITSISYNLNRQLIIIGHTNGDDMRLRNFLPPNPASQTTLFVAQLDSLNNVIAADAIISNSNRMSTSIFVNEYRMGEPITNKKGQVFISGWFEDSITLPCKTLRAIIGVDTFGRSYDDGYMLVYNPLRVIDTNVCSQLLAPSGRHLWDSSGIFFDTIPNALGCDSILAFKLHIVKSYSSLDSSVCFAMRSHSGKFFWDSSGTYFDTIPNALGCDSILQINLTVLNSKVLLDSTVMYSLTSPSGKYVWDSSGFYSDTLTNQFGCDSILRFKVTVLSNYATIDSFNCSPILYLSKNVWINSSGTFNDTIPNSLGGDSVITIRFTLGTNSSSLDTSYCNAVLSPSGKFWMHNSGYYSDTLTNSLLCDSIINIHFTRTATTDSIFFSSCDTLALPSGKGFLYTSGNYTDTLQTVWGCDSILFIQFTRLASFDSISYSICDSLLSPSGKFVFYTSGVFFDTLTNQFGCDSLITIFINKSNNLLSVTKSNDIDCTNPSSELLASGNGLFNFSWKPASSLNNPAIPNPTASPVVNTTYFVSATDSLGCVFNDSIPVLVNITDSLGFFPNVFTPNHDGFNDCLQLNSVTPFIEMHFWVYNRMGNLVYETTNPTDCWNGETFNGQKLPDGVYYFTLNGKSVCNKNIKLHGTVTIMR
ncbi:MAG: gliding motility-associated C-terminal domain-containing protein [Bacteroidia bacterium]|nr:gliding motility-associated C-terminal domain-containing protein [Bacteroidia bacterium]